jgi:hypothetical protein
MAGWRVAGKSAVGALVGERAGGGALGTGDGASVGVGKAVGGWSDEAHAASNMIEANIKTHSWRDMAISLSC